MGPGGRAKMGTDHQSLIKQKQTLFQNPGKNKIKNLHGAQKAYQLAETTARDGFCKAVAKAGF